ncbi:hypothetical protein FLL45_04315 [Aliikangiella marina]|uniref:Uncharacterized protein n=1 Tax=Aliikangiella marina TaxID=1712262 RepID=A0A545TIZ1_9GAMM|nr:hypothetical protein [Aliikangiella marina]TQV77178.1 hypothetical protein FLL45_04315 [Aliikangiella marina]
MASVNPTLCVVAREVIALLENATGVNVNPKPRQLHPNRNAVSAIKTVPKDVVLMASVNPTLCAVERAVIVPLENAIGVNVNPKPLQLHRSRNAVPAIKTAPKDVASTASVNLTHCAVVRAVTVPLENAIGVNVSRKYS